MENNRLTYCIASESDFEAINNFYNRIYSEHRTLEAFIWEFQKSPAGKAIYIIVKDGQRIVGTQSVIPIIMLNKQNEKILTGKSEDTLVDPEYRGKNIFNNMYDLLFQKCKERNIAFIWGFTFAKKPFQKLEFDIPYKQSQTIRVNNILKSYQYLEKLNPGNSLRKRIQILSGCCLSKIYTLGKNILKQLPPAYTISESKPAELNSLLHAILNHQDVPCFMIEQSSEFLEWRIYTNPNYDDVWSFSLSDQTGNLRASISVNIRKDGIAYIIQSLFHPDLPTNIKIKFVSTISQKLFKKNIYLIRNWHFAHSQFNREELDIFQKAGYFHLERGSFFVWKTMKKTIPYLPEHFILSRLATQGKK